MFTFFIHYNHLYKFSVSLKVERTLLRLEKNSLGFCTMNHWEALFLTARWKICAVKHRKSLHLKGKPCVMKPGLFSFNYEPSKDMWILLLSWQGRTPKKADYSLSYFAWMHLATMWLVFPSYRCVLEVFLSATPLHLIVLRAPTLNWRHMRKFWMTWSTICERVRYVLALPCVFLSGRFGW